MGAAFRLPHCDGCFLQNRRFASSADGQYGGRRGPYSFQYAKKVTVIQRRDQFRAEAISDRQAAGQAAEGKVVIQWGKHHGRGERPTKSGSQRTLCASRRPQTTAKPRICPWQGCWSHRHDTKTQICRPGRDGRYRLTSYPTGRRRNGNDDPHPGGSRRLRPGPLYRRPSPAGSGAWRRWQRPAAYGESQGSLKTRRTKARQPTRRPCQNSCQ